MINIDLRWSKKEMVHKGLSTFKKREEKKRKKKKKKEKRKKIKVKDLRK